MNEQEITNEAQEGFKGVAFSFGRDDDGNFVMQINIVMSIASAIAFAKTVFSIAKTIQQQSSGIIVAHDLPPELKR